MSRLSCISKRIESLVTVVADLQHTLKGVEGRDQECGTLCFGKTGRTGLQMDIFRRKFESNWDRREGGRAQPLKEWYTGEFPGRPVVRTWCFHCRGPGSTPDGGTKIPQAMWPALHPPPFPLPPHKKIPIDLEPHYKLTVIHVHAQWHTRRHHNSSEIGHKSPKSER